MLVHPGVASCRFATVADVFDGALFCAGKYGVRPGRRYSQTSGIRWRGCSSSGRNSDRQAGRLGGAKRQTELRRSGNALPTSAHFLESEVDGRQQQSGFGHGTDDKSALLSTDDEIATEDGEWITFGWDEAGESFSTSLRSEPTLLEDLGTSRNSGTNVETFQSSPSTSEPRLMEDLGTSRNSGTNVETFQSTPSTSEPRLLEDLGTSRNSGTNVETFQNVWRPLKEEGTTAERREGILDGLNGHGSVSSREINAAEDKEVVSSAHDSLDKVLPSRQVLHGLKPSQTKAPKTRRVSPAEERELPAPTADVEYYVPKIGDEVIGLVVSGDEYTLDVDIGSKQLGRMLSKDLKPFDAFRSDEFFWQMDDDDASLPAVPVSQIRFVGDEESLSEISPVSLPRSGLSLEESSPMLPVGSVLSLQVVGVTLSGRALLSARKIASRIAWQRVRQIHKQDEPFEVQCLAWNSDALVFKIEGLRAVMPRDQFLNKPTGQKSLKDYVGEWLNVLITEIDEAAGMLVVSEKRAWVWRNLRLGSLVVGTVQRILPFGIELILNGTGLRAMVHVSKMSHAHVPDISSIFSMGEHVKAVVIKSPIPYRIALSTALLESTQGLILQDKERLFQEAEETAARYRSTLPQVETDDEYQDKVGAHSEVVDLHVIANLDWLDFGEDRGIAALGSSEKDQ